MNELFRYVIKVDKTAVNSGLRTDPLMGQKVRRVANEGARWHAHTNRPSHMAGQ